MDIPRHGRQGADAGNFVAAEEVGRLREEVGAQLDRAVGAEWYEEHGNAIDEAALTLCRLRRARGGEKGGPRHGDEAVRQVLGEEDPARLHSSGWRAVQSRTWTRRASPRPSSPGSPRTLARRRRPPLLLDVLVDPAAASAEGMRRTRRYGASATRRALSPRTTVGPSPRSSRPLRVAAPRSPSA